MNGIIYFRNQKTQDYENQCITLSSSKLNTFGLLLLNTLKKYKLTYSKNMVKNFYVKLVHQTKCNMLYSSSMTTHISNIYTIEFDLDKKYITAIEFISFNKSNPGIKKFTQEKNDLLNKEFNSYNEKVNKQNLNFDKYINSVKFDKSLDKCLKDIDIDEKDFEEFFNATDPQ